MTADQKTIKNNLLWFITGTIIFVIASLCGALFMHFFVYNNSQVRGEVLYSNGKSASAVYVVLRKANETDSTKYIQKTATDSEGKYEMITDVDSDLYLIEAFEDTDTIRYKGDIKFQLLRREGQEVNIIIYPIK